MKTVLEITDSLKEEGFIHDFSIKDDSITVDSGKQAYAPEELMIEKTERYEGDSNPSDNAIIYAITAKDGIKGILTDSYGIYSDPRLAKIIASIPLREEHNLRITRLRI
ncbi:MAG: phosphoribosylpyrophosphate synthetase [Ignavibacteria bacterium]